MARVIRLNSSSGGAATAASISLADVEEAFSLPKHIETISVVSGASQSAIEFKNLDTRTYEHFKIVCSRVKTSANNSYLWFGGMVGSTRTTTQSWSSIGKYGSTQWTTNTTAEMRTFAANSSTSDLDAQNSYGMIEWNIYFPHPDQDATVSRKFLGNFYKWTADIGEQNQSGYFQFISEPSAVQDGFYFRPATGNFEQDQGMDSLFSIYGTKRRAAAA